jgi:hypothetical protein
LVAQDVAWSTSLSESNITELDRIVDNEPISTLCTPALTTPARLPQDFSSADNQAPVAAGIGTAQTQSLRADP